MNTKTINIISSLLLFILSIVTSSAQTIRDSLQYSELNNRSVSKNNNIAIIHKYNKFDSKRDSVFIFNKSKLSLNTQTSIPYKNFKENKVSYYDLNKQTLQIIDIHSLKKQTIFNVAKPTIIEDYELIFYLDTSSNIYRLVKVQFNKFEEIWNSPQDLVNITSINQNRQLLLIQYKDAAKGIEIINLKTLKKTVNKHITDPIKQVIWDKRLPIVFLSPNLYSDNKYPYLIFLNYNTNFFKKQELNPTISYSTPEAISEHSFKIIQYYNLGNKPYDVNKLELWSTNDRAFPINKESATLQNTTTNDHIIFDFKANQIYQPEILNKQESIALNENLLLVYDSNQYLDYTSQYSARPRDISLYDIKENKLSLITKAQRNTFNTTSLSPLANYFVYIKMGVIYFYNTKYKTVESTFNLKEDELKLRSYIGRFRYWSKDEKFFYFVSDSNLMQYNTEGKTFKTIINSGNSNSHYKLHNSLAPKKYNIDSQTHSNTILDNSKLLIEKYNIKDDTSSLWVIENNKQTEVVSNTKDHISEVQYSEDFKTITYCVENYNKPKTVYIYQNGQTKLLLENTMPKELYTWKQQKLVLYKDEYKNDLKGILFYPKDFDKNQSYPMITSIYEIQHDLFNRFTYPSYLNSDGFNKEIYLENNYFVFLPDILDTQKGTGLSALDCVEQSINTVLKQEKAIDKNRLGLFGFSHGGYETNFIVTQTNLFKAAVSGAGNSDIIRSYFSYNENFMSPFFFQFENGQYKMPKPFNEDKELYLLNSPILFANQIKTPLLSFTGKQDQNINWEQQQGFFMAMLRYNIPHVALFYKNEGHGLNLKENQIDITNRIKNWFDYYLKDINSPETYWVKYNTKIEKERLISN
ncbi:prolyl oligopeptidase family serine peptidase [Myroides odoratimimus]|uniref:alpha/beta hydrolase family protein n=2 Tax=Myroides odoratimimus TaxID=76832 RepID=UPI002574F429|nr:prolyl oligopeptidase family serine peptidase [Myroides odoratimimus]MDM1496663.1 prolyl oligopeptidase family serine peptidase [Myroides odoratimimus]